jgi:hypothetical protein
MQGTACSDNLPTVSLAHLKISSKLDLGFSSVLALMLLRGAMALTPLS